MGIDVKLKYYLRGLGIGIIVTALLMGASDKNQVTAKNDDYILESESAEDIAGFEKKDEVKTLETKPQEAITEEYEIQETKTEENTAKISTEELLEAEKAKDEINTTKDSENEAAETISDITIETDKTAVEESSALEESQELSKEVQDLIQMTKESSASAYTLEIVRGDDSGTVSRKLQNAGIVENASEFDAFLMQHGYDKKISIGTVQIQKGASWVEIAEKLSGK